MTLQLFNMINCRKLGTRDFNVFENFFHNWLFLIIMAINFSMQYFIFDWFSGVFQTVALSKEEFGGCLAVGFTSILICPLAKLAPDRWFAKINMTRAIDENKEAPQPAVMKRFSAAAKPKVPEQVPT